MNNFNTSTSGVNLELDISWDLEMGRIDFDENFKKLEDGSLQFVDCGNFKQIDLADRNMYKITVKDLKAAILDYHMNDIHSVSDVSRYYLDKPFSSLKKDELFELVENFMGNKKELIEFYQTYAEPLYDIIKVTGYSQGDVSEVIFAHCDMKEYSYDDKDTFIKEKQYYFEKLIYSQPLLCILKVNNEEHILSQSIKDVYDYEADEILKVADTHVTHTHKPYIMEWLKENLPSSPDYQ